MRYGEIINEGINDKGIFKAIFLAGLPGSGKSSVIARITDGSISPRIVNTDKSFEFLSRKAGIEANKVAWGLLGQQSRTINNTLLFNYLNGMLPLFIDGTSSNISSLLRRAGLLESLGYDTMMIWVNTSLETALKRAAGRDRKVQPEFIKKVYDSAASNKEFYRSRFGKNFIEVDNNASNFDAMEGKLFNVATAFFNAPVTNPIGNMVLKKMQSEGAKYLIPAIVDENHIKRLISVWYT